MDQWQECCAFNHSWVAKSFNLAKRWAEVGHAALGNPNAVVEHVCNQSWEHVSPSNQLDRGQERDTSLSFTHGLASGVMCIDLRQTFHSREQGKATCTVSNKLARN